MERVADWINIYSIKYLEAGSKMPVVAFCRLVWNEQISFGSRSGGRVSWQMRERRHAQVRGCDEVASGTEAAHGKPSLLKQAVHGLDLL